ncbi:SCY1-like protein 2 [Caerostris darwini]|uniref:SCY1-like protein 2 n=1 Tax=Caerostris darwini TaxID=1538125 RepID=A0AAV4T7I0_9ARAC|nr:SCY1-like protein 2 [Caerostris darwini]
MYGKNEFCLFSLHDLTQSPVPCQPFTSKLPKMGQPDLDFTAPEVQATSSCSPLSDMFSLGMLICAIFNNGRPLIDANHSTVNYTKQLELVSMRFSTFTLPKSHL